jgi:hypothetical protein
LDQLREPERRYRRGNYIEQTLKTDPQNKGESRNENKRILLEAPLGIDFMIDILDRKVTVLTVWKY